MRVVDERWEVGRRGVKRDEQKRGQGCTGDGIVCSACVCVVYYKLLYKGVITTLFLFVFVQKVPLECNNSRSLSHTYTLIHHSAWWEVWSKPVLTTCIFQEGDYNSKQGKTHMNKTVCRTSGACEEVSGKTSYHGIVFKAEEV